MWIRILLTVKTVIVDRPTMQVTYNPDVDNGSVYKAH